MSTSAPSNSQLTYIGEQPETSSPTLPVESPGTNPSSNLDLARLERLVDQLEARSTALVTYERRHHRPPAANKAALVATLGALWLGALVLTVAYIRFTGRAQQQSVDQARVANHRVISIVPNPDAWKLTTSVDQLEKALISSSDKLNRLESAVQCSNSNIVPARVENPPPIAQPPTAQAQITAMTEFPDAATVLAAAPLDASLPKYLDIAQIQPSNTAVPHQTDDGTVDYWMMPRRHNDNAPARVLCIGKAPHGVVVRNLEDGKYYTVTQAGTWNRIPVPPSAN